MYYFVCLCVHKVLDGSESQYSGMQIGTLQDEEDEGAAPSSQEEQLEPFSHSALGMYSHSQKDASLRWSEVNFFLCVCSFE